MLVPLPALDHERPGLLLAPHLSYPPQNGADLLVERNAQALSVHLAELVVVAQSVVVRYVNGEIVESTPYANELRTPTLAAVRTLILRSNYLCEKFLTPSYEKQARTYLKDPVYGSVWYSYLETSRIRDQAEELPPRFEAAWTHNDQLKWFRTLQQATSNPLRKWVAHRSGQWHVDHMPHHRDLLHLYVTEADRQGHMEALGSHPSLVVPIGTDVLQKDQVDPLPPNETPSILFVGALSATMNQDALRHFAEVYAPVLQDHFSGRMRVRVVGSAPPRHVRTLCQDQGWELHPDVSDGRLAELYADATCTILPFSYATGAKLKLLGALGHGVPYLASEAVAGQITHVAPNCLISNDPREWAAHLDMLTRKGLNLDLRYALLSEAVQYSWPAVVSRMLDVLQATTNTAK